MAALTVQEVVEAGLEVTYENAAAGGDTMQNTGREFLHVKNGDASDKTVTITVQNASAQKAGFGTVTKSSAVVVVTAGEERFIGPFPTTAFNNNGVIAITYSAVTSVTVAALKLPLVQ